MVDNKEQQMDLASQLQEKWLRRMDALLDSGEITSTDLATLARVLMANGWTLDPTRLPKQIKDKLTSDIEFDGEETEPRIRLAR
jgi:hypothetical protein